MIEINLLPEEHRKKESPLGGIDITSVVLSNLSFAKFALVVCGVLVAAHAALFALGMIGKARVSSMAGKKSLLGDREKEALALKLKADVMNRKKAAIDELMVKRFEWARKLNDISDSMTANIWLSELSYDEKQAGDKGAMRYLIISGYASSKSEEGTALIGKFIKSLKGNESFYRDFSDIELGSIKRDKVEDQDVMNFRITCLFKEGK